MEQESDLKSFLSQHKADLFRTALNFDPIRRHALDKLIVEAEPGSVWVNPRPKDVKPLISLDEAERYVESEIIRLKERVLSRDLLTLGGNEVTNQALEDIKTDERERLNRKYKVVDLNSPK